MASIAPNRSRTDPPATENPFSELRVHIPRRKHANTLRSSDRPSHHHGHRKRDTVQSAIDIKPPISFDHLLRRDKKNSDPRRSLDSSRQGSVIPPPPQLDGQVEAVRKHVKPEDVAKAKRDNERREEELRESLKSVEEVGMNSTRQLDDTYYAILEKASLLRSTVASLQQLADESRRMHTTFEEDTKKLEKDTQSNLNSFGNFNGQEQTINDLVNQLENSRKETNKLNDRLENARLRVEAFEERDSVKQTKQRRRLHITWATLLALMVLVIAVVLAKNRRAVGHQLARVEEHLVKIGDAVEEVASPLGARLRPSPSDDPYLRKLFDEL